MQMDPFTHILGTQTAQKMASSSHFLTILKRRSATGESWSRPPPLSFLPKLCVIVLHTHSCHQPKFQPNPKHHHRNLLSPHSACGACLPLPPVLATPGRSTLDTKWATMGSKWAKYTCLSTPSGLGTNLEKMIFDRCWTHK